MATGFALCRYTLYNGKYEKQKDDKSTASKENQRREVPHVGIPSSKMGRLEKRAEKVTNSLDIYIMRWYNQHMKTNEKENMSYKSENTMNGQWVAQLKREMVKKLCDEIITLRKENEQLKELLEKKYSSKKKNLSVTLDNPKYVKNADKEQLLKIILNKFKAENPKAGAITFQQVKAMLSHYGVKTKTIGNFFRRQLLNYETTGGNKRKFILLSREKENHELQI